MTKIAGVTIGTIVMSWCPAVMLFYGGDSYGGGGIRNGVNTEADGKVYDDFDVRDSAGWLVRQTWSNNLLANATIHSAEVEIRQNVSRGNGGVLVFAGRFAATAFETGREAFGLREFTVLVADLKVALTPGKYWLNVAPVGNGPETDSFLSYTRGLNAVGAPIGNGNSFFDSRFFGYVFESTENVVGGARDFSMGVAGEVVPEPASGSVLLGALLLLGRKLPQRKTGAGR